MKKFIMILIMATLATTFINLAQSKAEEHREILHVGLKIGVNYSNVWDSEGEDFVANSAFGLVFGGFVSIPIWKYVGFQPGLLFSQKGFEGSGKILGGDYRLTRTTNYIAIPLLATLRPIKEITIVAGPQYSYLVKQTDVFENALTTVEQEQEFENDNIRNNTLSFLIGLDVNMDQLVFGTRLGWDLHQNHGDGNSHTPRYRNSWVQFTVGYRFQ
ncbi:MAG: PorT family protein [Ignavibacteriae bacterium HGW-Ignavibacteriae-1]|jgi:hypothetical protein|nr:MAG: PorT family protein [Ignavibacteriae bacterium HGW-Ignavibacteriae-1]